MTQYAKSTGCFKLGQIVLGRLFWKRKTEKVLVYLNLKDIFKGAILEKKEDKNELT